MDEVYLEIYSLSDLCLAPIETIVTLFTIKYCDSNINIKLIRGTQQPNERAYGIDVSNFVYEIIDAREIPYYASSCALPNITMNKSSCVAGLCAILRQIIKDTITDRPTHRCRPLLGFKGACLLACSEASVWTKFCEVDLIVTLKTLNEKSLTRTELPSSIARFECHMSHPVRLHNLYKCAEPKRCTVDGTLKRAIPEHTFAEGSTVTLADIIIFVCVHILLSVFSRPTIVQLIPLTNKWYERMVKDQAILDCLSCLPPEKIERPSRTNYTLPIIANQSLYKSDPKRYKPRSRIYTRQEDIERSLGLIGRLQIDTTLDAEPFAGEVCLDWNDVPFDATPEGGSLPPSRLKRKQEQLQNLCKPVMKLARPGDVIVDFCSGSGHLGILIAHLLPRCTVVLLENKEESLNRAKDRVRKLALTNVRFYQCNLDYFKGHFDIGTSLHACGVATDLVIQQCVKRNAVFVSCPCCYGSLHDCHRLTYPRSDRFKKEIANEAYMIVSHAADQTHDEGNAKTKQGYECMSVVDTDRKLHAEQYGYKVYLSKLIPETCTPKNHILVGIPGSKVNENTHGS